MNAKILVESLNDPERKEILQLLREWERERDKDDARFYVLDPLFQTMVKEGKKIEAIRAFKESRQISLTLAKAVVDRYDKSLKLNLE